jgi:hypothetical protein
MEETMLKLAALVCLLGVAGLIIVGGCTPEANRTWSESTDFSGFQVEDWSGPYAVSASLDEEFTSLNIYHTGSSLQGFDNFRRSWFGSISAATSSPAVNLETSDGPRGTEVFVGNAYIVVTLTGSFKAMGGTHWASPRTGTIEMLGLGIPDS